MALAALQGQVRYLHSCVSTRERVQSFKFPIIVLLEVQSAHTLHERHATQIGHNLH